MSIEAHTNQEVQSPLDKEAVYFLIDATSKLVLRVNEGQEKSDLTDLRIFLSHLTLPQGETLENYLASLGLDQHIATIQQNTTQAGNLLGGLAVGIRSRDIRWYDYEDPILREAMVTRGQKLDADKECEVSYWNNSYHVRWVLPKPEVYWECEEPDKLIHIAVIALEEMIHLTQIKGNKIELHSLGCEFDLSDPDLKPMQHFVVRMCELDAFNILSTAMPQMIEQNWGWYQDRASKKTYDDHHPHSIDISFILGYTISLAMGQGKDYMAGTMVYLPEFLDENPTKREAFFSNHYVLKIIKQYFEWIYDSEDLATKLEADQIILIHQHEFDRHGMTTQFLIHCAKLRESYKESWVEALDRGKFDADVDSSMHGSDILNIILDFVNNHPTEFNKLSNRKTLLRILARSKFKTTDQMVSSFAQNLE